MLSSAFFIESDPNRAFCVRNVSAALWLPLSQNGLSHLNPLRGAITFPLKREGIRDPCSFFFIQFAHGPQTKRRAVNRAGVANELAGKIQSGGPSCHPLGDGFKTSGDTSLINLHILCRSAHQDAVN